MDPEKLIAHARRIKQGSSGRSVLAEAREFLRVYAGPKNAFLAQLNNVPDTWASDYIMEFVTATLDAFIRYIENGLLEGISIQRRAQIDVVSDFLSQAQQLLEQPKVHPAAPTVIIGAALEEFLRNWVEEAGISIGRRKPGIEAYSNSLREAEITNKQDAKDITSWAGLRNYAAHGEWHEVEDKHRISIMLEGVNLFMRKYGRVA